MGYPFKELNAKKWVILGSLFKELKCIESGDSICRLADEWVKTDSVKQMFTSNIYVSWLVKLLKNLNSITSNDRLLHYNRRRLN